MFQEPPILAWVESVSAAEVVDSRRGRFTGCCNQRLIRWKKPGSHPPSGRVSWKMCPWLGH